jgi:hypothetical protein
LLSVKQRAEEQMSKLNPNVTPKEKP